MLREEARMTLSIRLDEHRLVAACSERYDPAARSMLERFAQLHAAGPRLHPGSHIDFGWAVLQIEARGEDWLVCEPDFESEPMRWLPSVDATLGVLDAQATLMRRLGLPPRATRGDQLLWLAPDALDAARVYLHRSEPGSAAESGWYIGRDRDAGDEGEAQRGVRIRAGRLLILKPEWLQLLTLPPGCLVQFEDGKIAAIYDDRDRCIYPPN